MPVTSNTIRVEGLRQLNTAFSRIEDDTGKRVREGLKVAAEPVRVDAERLAVVTIKRGNIPWWQMRVGATKAFVYVAPKRRSIHRGDPRFSRPKFAKKKLLPAEERALAMNAGQVERNVEKTMADLAADWGRGG